MKNADKFKSVFGLYATEVWSMPEGEFLRWLNSESTETEQRWIPFKTRELTDEEKEEHPEWDCVLECELPEDGQRTLVSIDLRGHEEVQNDEFYTDDGCYLDSGYEIGSEAVAWMPLPEPYRGKQK